MLNNTGHLLIFLVMVLSLTIIYKSYLELKISSQKISNSIYQLSLFQSTFAISSFLVLIVAFINSDFSLINVYENSHSAKPLFYKITGAWGNHEGSLLLWINYTIMFSPNPHIGSYMILFSTLAHKITL